MNPRPRAEPSVSELLEEGIARLTGAGIETARLDAELLLAGVLATDRTGLHRRREERPAPDRIAIFRAWLKARSAGQPAAQLLGEWEFYALPLLVDEHVLIPRPETELLVDWARELPSPRRIADIGTGSGCLAVTLAVCFPHASVDATDLSPAALAVAGRNVRRHGLEARVRLLEGDLLAPLASTVPPHYELLVSNPPYVADGDPLLDPLVARHEPALALIDPDGDGLGFYRRFAREAVPFLAPGGTLLLEIGDGQATAVRAILERAGWRVEIRSDLAGIPRAVRATREPTDSAGSQIAAGEESGDVRG